MSAKITTVRLTALDCGRTKVFAVERAERLLRDKHSLWRLADGEKVEFTENGFRLKSNINGDKNPVKAKSDTPSEETAGVD